MLPSAAYAKLGCALAQPAVQRGKWSNVISGWLAETPLQASASDARRCSRIGRDRGVTIHKDFLRRQSRSADTIIAAVADNCRFDERAGAARWQRFDAMLSELAADPGTIHWKDCAESNQSHLERYCNVPSLSVPDAFLGINQAAWLDELPTTSEARDLHLLALQVECDREDFGEPLAGRT